VTTKPDYSIFMTGATDGGFADITVYNCLTVDTSITQSDVTNYHTGTVALTGADIIVEKDLPGRDFISTGIVYAQTIQTLDNTGTPAVSTGNRFQTGGTTNITDFDEGVAGQIIFVLCLHTLNFDTTTAQDADHNLDGSSADLAGETGDTLMWWCTNGTTWQLISYTDATDDNN